MDKYMEECKACRCKKAEEMRHEYDVWFNCNSCPFTECYEPNTRELYLAGVTEREEEYKKTEAMLEALAMEVEKYKKSECHNEQVAFAASIRQKVESNVLLTPEEFERAVSFHWTRSARYLDFFSVEELVIYQLSLLGYNGAAREIANYMEGV